jgi:hypothetical protein
MCVHGHRGQAPWFPGFIRGIEADPENIKTIKAMRPPARFKDAQKLTRCLAVPSWSIFRLAERAILFFKLLWKSGPFV